MNQIDFLPAEYRQKRVHRHAQPWRVLVVAGFGILIGVAAVGQHRRLARLDAELAQTIPQYDAAMAASDELDLLNRQIESGKTDAELITYLRHRWPTTQILDALLAGLPDEITFDELEIHQESAPKAATERDTRASREAEAQRLAKLTPTAQDLEQLRGESDDQRTVVTISGLTTDSAVLHRYLGDLAHQGLFLKAELNAIESDPASDSLRFRVSIVVRPGYGQPGGPPVSSPDVPTEPKTEQPIRTEQQA